MARFATIAAIAFVAVLCTRSSAQQPACTPAIVSLSPCIAFVTGNSSFPTSPCCSQLSTVIQTQARCLCTFLSSGATQLGFKINQTQALTLPGACKIQTPPLSQCNAVAGAPAASQEGAPAPAPAVPSSSINISPSTAATPSEQSPSAPIVPSVPSSSSSPTTPSTPTTVTPSDGGVKTVPTTSSQSSGVGSSTPCVFMFLLLVASTFSSF